MGRPAARVWNLCDVTLPWRQDALLDRVRELTDAPLVSVVVSGRAHVLTPCA